MAGTQSLCVHRSFSQCWACSASTPVAHDSSSGRLAGAHPRQWAHRQLSHGCQGCLFQAGLSGPLPLLLLLPPSLPLLVGRRGEGTAALLLLLFLPLFLLPLLIILNVLIFNVLLAITSA